MDTALFDRVRRLNLPQRHYAIFGSGPLAIRQIIPECGDIDILCKEAVWKIVVELGTVELLPQYNVEIATLDDGAITFGTKWGIGNFDVEELINTADQIQDLPFVRLQHVARYKRIRGSAKDITHLKALANSKYSTRAG